MKYIHTFLFVFSFFSLTAQNIGDVIRYSTIEFGATGRAIGTGSSFSAIGADFSLIGSNPAGLAVFRKSELVVTPSFGLINTNANLSEDNGISLSDRKRAISLSNFGIAFVSNKPSSKWKTFNFGIGINRLASFGKNIQYEGSTTGSISDRWLELSQNFSPDELAQDPFEAGLALDASVIYQNSTTGDREYTSDYRAFRATALDKSQTVAQQGYLSEFGISLASNYNNKFYIGGMLGLPILFFEEEKIYKETDTDGSIDFFDDLEFKENLSTVGIGVNFKLGVIYRLNQKVRLGLAGHTATVFGLEEDFNTSIDYEYTDLSVLDPSSEPLDSPSGNFQYSLRTPWRLSGSVGTIIAKRGFVSAEVEYVDYANSRFNFESEAGAEIDRQNRLNAEINSDLNATANIRLGGEWTYDIFRFRAGVNFLGAVSNDADSRITYNAGLGMRKNSFFMDLAYRFDRKEESFYAYQTQQSSSLLVQNDVMNNRFILTFGFKI